MHVNFYQLNSENQRCGLTAMNNLVVIVLQRTQTKNKIGTDKCFKFHQIFVIRIGKCMYVCHLLWHIGADI